MTATVFFLEWLLASRRGQHHRLRNVFLLILFVEVMLFHYSILGSLVRALVRADQQGQAVLIERFQAFFYLLLWQQPIAIAVLAPAMSAGSISDEKQRGTLDFLLLAPLSSAEVVLGKWLAQCSQLFTLVCPAYGLLAVVAGLLSGSFWQFAWMIGFHLLLIGALSALGLLASVWARTTIRAVLGVYLFLAAGLALARAFDVPLFAFDFSPTGDDGSGHGLTGSFLLGVTLVCLTLAIARLRPAHEQQRTSLPTTNAHDRDLAMGDSPMRWKERHAGGWVTVPVWGALPFLGRILLVTLATGIVTMIPPINEERIVLVAVGFFFLSTIWVGIRCAGAITSEREKQTWDALIVTQLDARQIVRGKLWGNLDAVRPYTLAYLPPALIGAAQVGWITFACVAYLWLAGWAFMYFIAACGLYSSARSTSTWRSLIATLGRAIGMTLVACLAVGIPLTSAFLFCLCLLEIARGIHMTASFAGLLMLVGIFTPILIWLFAHTESLLEQTEQEWLVLKENANIRRED